MQCNTPVLSMGDPPENTRSYSQPSRHASSGLLVERVVVGPDGADIRLRAAGLTPAHPQRC